MSLAHAMWIHGHNMQIEFPERVGSVWRAGFYIQVAGNSGTNNWFHFAIPTPVIVDDSRLRVGSVMLRFRAGPFAKVNAVHVYDGENKIAAHENLSLGSENWGFHRFEVPGNPEILWGLGISIGAGFNIGPGNNTIDFSSAGCDFLSNK